MFDEKEVKVLVTGFGPFLDITTNPSWEIARQLPSTISTFTASQIRVILPQDPIPAAYHQIYSRIPRLLEERNPDIVLHMGLEVESPAGCFKIERKAPKEGYHQIPDIERKVFTRAENTNAFGKKGPAELACGLDLEDVEARWRDACRSISLPADGREILKQAGKGLKKDQRGKPIDVCLTDDVGTYVCGFCYYLGLHEMQKKTGQKNVVFLHVPNLDDEEKVKAGVRVTEELIKALVAVWEENRLS